MKHDLRFLSDLFIFALVIGLFACARPTTIPPKPTQSEYLAVEYRRLVSGVYNEELANKYVKLDCQFQSPGLAELPKGYSSARYMGFSVVGPRSTTLDISLLTPMMVVIPKDLADFVFSLRPGDQIKVYGRVVPRYWQERFGDKRISMTIFLEGNLIEKSEAK